MSNYIRFRQPTAVQGLLSFESLCEANDLLQIDLSKDPNFKLKLRFSDHVSFRKVDEGDALVTLNEMNLRGVLGQSLYECVNSDFLDQFVKRSNDIRKGQTIMHFLILTDQDVIDVLSLSAPEIILENN